MQTVPAPSVPSNPDAAYDAAAAAELVARYPGLRAMPDADLIDLIANPPALMGDVDEVVAVAAILIDQRLNPAAA